MHSQTTDMKYPPMLTRCGRYDDSPERSILLKHKDEGFIPSTPMPAHNATLSETREFLLTILLEREVPVETAKYIASQWRGGEGLQLQIVNYAHYQCYFKDKNAQVIYRDVHAIIRRESKLRQRQRDARRQRANLAKLPGLLLNPILFLIMALLIGYFVFPRVDALAVFYVLETILLTFMVGPLNDFTSLDEGTFDCLLDNDTPRVVELD